MSNDERGETSVMTRDVTTSDEAVPVCRSE